MTEYYCPDDCKLQGDCSLKHRLHGERFTDNPSNKTCWCYLKPLPVLTSHKRTIKSPPKPRPTSLKAIKEAVKKAPPKRARR